MTLEELYTEFQRFSLNKVIRYFVSGDKGLIDQFIKRYPSMAIFVMDILARKEAIAVLNKLELDTIIKMIQEEARIIILNQLSKGSHRDFSPEDMMYITMLLEKVGTNAPFTEEDLEFVYLIYREYKRKRLRKFKFFDALSLEQKIEVAKYLMDNDPIAFILSILLTPMDIRFLILDNLNDEYFGRAINMFKDIVILEYAIYSLRPIEDIVKFLKDEKLKGLLLKYSDRKKRYIEGYNALREEALSIKDFEHEKNKIIGKFYAVLSKYPKDDREALIDKVVWDRLIPKEFGIALKKLSYKV